MTTTEGEQTTRQTELNRAISPLVLALLVLGDILGTGIYALVGEVGGEVGGAIWAALLVALILAFFTAASYSELVTKCLRWRLPLGAHHSAAGGRGDRCCSDRIHGGHRDLVWS